MAKVNPLFFVNVLKELNLPSTTNNVKFLTIWQTYEGGSAKNNPLNTTMKYVNASDYNSAKVKNYLTEDDGINATAKTLSLNYYKAIIKGFKENQSLDYYKNNADVIKALKTWGTVNFANYLNKPVPVPNGQPVPVPKTDEPEKKNLFQTYKKPIFITIGILSLVGITYLITKDGKTKVHQY